MVLFRKKALINGYAELNARYRDMYDSLGGQNFGKTFRIDGQGSTAAVQNSYGYGSLRGGPMGTKAIFSSNLPKQPAFGAGKPLFAELNLFIEDVILEEGSTSTPKITLFKCKEDTVKFNDTGSVLRVTGNESGPSMRQKKGHVYALSANMNNYISDEEKFTGEPTNYTYNSTVEYRPIGRTLVRTTKPYLEAEDMYEYGFKYQYQGDGRDPRYGGGRMVASYLKNRGKSLRYFRVRHCSKGTHGGVSGDRGERQMCFIERDTNGRWRSTHNNKGAGYVYFYDTEISGVIVSGTETPVESDEKYNNQITPMNSFFDVVKQDRELSLDPESDDPVLVGSAITRFSTKNNLRGNGQSMEMFTFWAGDNRIDSSGSIGTSGSATESLQKMRQFYKPVNGSIQIDNNEQNDVQETFASYGPVPFPAHIFPSWAAELPFTENTVSTVVADNEVNFGSSHGFTAGTPILFPHGGGLDSGGDLVTGQLFYVSATSASSSSKFKVSTKRDGSDVVDMTSGSNDSSVKLFSVSGNTNHSSIGGYVNGEIEVDLDLTGLDVGQRYVDSGGDQMSLVRRAFCITYGYHKPKQSDSLLSYIDKHIPFSGLADQALLTSDTDAAPLLGWSFFRSKGELDANNVGDGLHVVTIDDWRINKDYDAEGAASDVYDVYVDIDSAAQAKGTPTFGIKQNTIPPGYTTLKIKMGPTQGSMTASSSVSFAHNVEYGFHDTKTGVAIPNRESTVGIEDVDTSTGDATHMIGNDFVTSCWWTGRAGMSSTNSQGGQFFHNDPDYFDAASNAGSGPTDANAIWPRYLTFWLCNYPNVSSTSNSDLCLEDDGGEITMNIDGTDEVMRRPTTSSVFIDGIRFKNFNYEHSNATTPIVGHNPNSLIIPSPASTSVKNGFTKHAHTGAFPGFNFLLFGSDTRADFDNSENTGIFLNDFQADLSALNEIYSVKTFCSFRYMGTDMFDGTSVTMYDDTIQQQSGTDGSGSFYGNQARTSTLGGGKTNAYVDGSEFTGGLLKQDDSQSEYVDFGAPAASPKGAVDYFTNKGFIHLKGVVDGTDKMTEVNTGHNMGDDPIFSKREMIYCSSRVLRATPESGVYKLDTVEPLRHCEGENLICYLWGSANRQEGNSVTNDTDGGDSNTVRTGVKILSIIDNKHVQLDWNGKSNTGQDMITDKQLPYLMISPYKFWIGVMNQNFLGLYNYNTGGIDWTMGSGRQYRSALITESESSSAALSTNPAQNHYGLFGPTWNEWLYNDTPSITGAYENKWSHDIEDENSIIDDRDFGFGQYDEQTDKGGEISIGSPRVGRYNAFRMKKIFESDIELGERLDLILDSDSDTKHEVLYHNNLNKNDHGITFQTSRQLTDYSPHLDRLPYLVTVFEDELPSTPKLSVVPYDEDPFYPEFKIETSDDDLWYGFMMIDKEPIKTQYDGAIIHFPFNDEGDDGRSVGTSHGKTPYEVVTLTPGTTMEKINTDVSDNEIDSVGTSAVTLEPGTPVLFTDLDNTTNPENGREYFISQTAGTGSGKYKLSTDPDGSPIGDVTFAGADDSNKVAVFGLRIANKAFLNNSDTGTSNGQYANVLGGFFRSSAPSGHFAAVSSGANGPRHTIEGLAGNALKFSRPTSEGGNGAEVVGGSRAENDHIQYYPPSGNVLSDLTTEASFVMHIIPDATTNGTENYIMHSGTCVVNLNGSTNKIEVDVFHAASNNVRLTSNPIPVDGQTPTNIIVTFDRHLKAGNCKLFIDGELVDQTGPSQSADSGADGINWKTDTNIRVVPASTSPLTIGTIHDTSSGHTHTKGFTGIIEEVVIYKRVLYPISGNQKSFVFTKPLQEIQDGSPVSYSARLFMKDYHNIRGDTASDVATSSSVSYTKAAFRLGD